MMWSLAILVLLLTTLSNSFFLWSGLKGSFKGITTVIEEKHKQSEALKHTDHSQYFSFRSLEIENLVKDLADQRTKINIKKSEVEKMIDAVKLEKKEIESTKEALLKFQEKILSHITLIEKKEEKNLKTLAQTYASLPPANTVEIFNHMDDIMVVKILNFLDSDTIGPIFQAMTANTAEPDLAIKRVVRLTKLLRLKTDAFE